VARVATREFAADLLVGAVPKSCEVLRDLHRLAIGCEQVDDHRNSAACDAGCLQSAEKILEARCDPGWLSHFVMHHHFAPCTDGDFFGGKVFQRARGVVRQKFARILPELLFTEFAVGALAVTGVHEEEFKLLGL